MRYYEICYNIGKKKQKNKVKVDEVTSFFVGKSKVVIMFGYR